MKKLWKGLAVAALLAIIAGYGWAGGSGENATSGSSGPVTVTIFDGTGGEGFSSDDPVWSENPVGKKITELTGIKIKMDVPAGQDADQKLNLLMASGDYPEMFITNSLTTIGKAINEKIAVPLDDLVNTYGQDIKKAFGDNLSKLRWSDGKLYYIAQKPGLPADFSGPRTGYGSGGFTIRKDVYEALGEPQIKTIDDIYNILVQIKKQYTTTKDGQPIWPMGAFYQTWQNIRDSLAMGAGLYSSGKWYLDPNGNLSYWTRSPQAYTIANFLNKIYREGLLDPEYITIDRTAWTNKLATGQVLTGLNPWWMNWTTQTTLASAGFGKAEDLIFVNFPFSVPGGQTPKFVEVSAIGGPYKVITTAMKDPSVGMKLLDALAVPENAFMTNNGIAGGMWDWVNGKPVMKDEFVQKFNNGAADEEFAADYGYRLYHPLATFPGNEVSTPWDTFWILKDDPVATGNERAARRDRLFSPYWYDTTPFAEAMKGMDENLTGIWTKAEDMIMNDFYVVVTQRTQADFQAKWKEYLANLDNIGIQKVEAYANEHYHEYMSK